MKTIVHIGACILVAALLFPFSAPEVEAQVFTLPDLPGNSSIQFVGDFFDTRDVDFRAEIHGFLPTRGIDWLPGSDGAGYFVISGDGTRNGGYRTSCQHGLWLFSDSDGQLVDSAQKAYDPGFATDGSWVDCAHPSSPSTEAVLLSDGRFMFQTLTGLGLGYSIYDAGSEGLSFVDFIPSPESYSLVPYAAGRVFAQKPSPYALLAVPGGTPQATFGANPFTGGPNTSVFNRNFVASNLGPYVLKEVGGISDKEVYVYEYTNQRIVDKGIILTSEDVANYALVYARDNTNENVGWVVGKRFSGQGDALVAWKLEVGQDGVSVSETHTLEHSTSILGSSSVSAAGDFLLVGYRQVNGPAHNQTEHTYGVVYENGEPYAAFEIAGTEDNPDTFVDVEISPDGTIVAKKNHTTFSLYRIGNFNPGGGGDTGGGGGTDRVPSGVITPDLNFLFDFTALYMQLLQDLMKGAINVDTIRGANSSRNRGNTPDATQGNGGTSSFDRLRQFLNF